MDSMRVSNERLQRALKKERARNSTLSDVNKKLVSKMHLMEEEAVGGTEESPAVSNESHLPQNSQQTGTFAEDLDVSSTELDPLKPTYNMPLSKFADVGLSSDSESASETKLGHTMPLSQPPSRNPFSVAGTSSPRTIMPTGNAWDSQHQVGPPTSKP
ncbi:hypothetical protein DL89DRAFT_292205 [Linderina pennispora]|uniref:Uncharacterized protein n=1 Tax=Linderina pennispora TaxID=61395 RepID=A0A1Y1WAG8_9FUNG|nr:uncharacterized protein DL89DRAFT_292205 [Linderina pennispora]ORX70550.1 hypothetical protein DL89DRAFT_292205 [Linderina pennispora]